MILLNQSTKVKKIDTKKPRCRDESNEAHVTNDPSVTYYLLCPFFASHKSQTHLLPLAATLALG